MFSGGRFFLLSGSLSGGLGLPGEPCPPWTWLKALPPGLRRSPLPG